MSHTAGWIGVDLDGTLAEYNGWYGIDHIGKPIPKMLKRVRDWLDEGQEVKIFTARVSGPDATAARLAIEAWCQKYIGTLLHVTNVKDFAMLELWDDRVVQVAPNTGTSAQEQIELLQTQIQRLRRRCNRVTSRTKTCRCQGS